MGECFCIILDGTISVKAPTLSNAENNENDDNEEHDDENCVEIQVLYSGAAFGQMSLMHETPHYTSFQCKRDSWIMILEKSSYTEILGKYEYQKNEAKSKFLQ